MTRFVKPRSTTRTLPQGDFTFTPKVKVFAAEDTAQLLEDAINIYTEAFLLLELRMIDNIRIEYQTPVMNNQIKYSALVHYTQIDIV